MKKKNFKKSSKSEEIARSIDKFKAFGLQADQVDENLEIDGDKIIGGKRDTTVETHWPTSGNIK